MQASGYSCHRCWEAFALTYGFLWLANALPGWKAPAESRCHPCSHMTVQMEHAECAIVMHHHDQQRQQQKQQLRVQSLPTSERCSL
jgi:hypothetical protein